MKRGREESEQTIGQQDSLLTVRCTQQSTTPRCDTYAHPPPPITCIDAGLIPLHSNIFTTRVTQNPIEMDDELCESVRKRLKRGLTKCELTVGQLDSGAGQQQHPQSMGTVVDADWGAAREGGDVIVQSSVKMR